MSSNDLDLFEFYLSKYELLHDRYMIEWQRAASLESKATCIIGFVGILSIFGINLGILNVKYVMSSNCVYCFFVIFVIFFIVTFLLALESLLKGSSQMMALNYNYIMNKYKFKDARLKDICNELYGITEYNNRINESKNKTLKLSIVMFFISTLCLFTFTYWCVDTQQPVINENNSSDISINKTVQNRSFDPNSTIDSIITINNSVFNPSKQKVLIPTR